MGLKKSVAAHFKEYEIDINNEDGSFCHKQKIRDWIEQLEVDMTPEEEAEIRASWAVGDSVMNQPAKPTPEQEHEWLIEKGADYIKEQRTMWKQAYDAWLINHQPLVDEHRKAADVYKKSTE